MSDLISREDVLAIVQEWTYCSDVEDLVRALPAVQPEAPAIREAVRMLDDIVCGRGAFGLDPAQDLQWATKTAAAALALIDKRGKEVRPDEPRNSRAPRPTSDIGPGDQAVAGAARKLPELLDELLDAIGFLEGAIFQVRRETADLTSQLQGKPAQVAGAAQKGDSHE
jgi:hypothetical protein